MRFPSNRLLSEARAQAVLTYLARNGVAPDRLRAVPRADTEPLCQTCDQNDPQVRAQNRRVEIELFSRVGRE